MSSEPQTLASRAETDWDSGMSHVGDPHQEILETCRERGWLDLHTKMWNFRLTDPDDDWMAHPKGHYQPGVIALSKDGRVLYRWRCIPTRKNIGGAVARPEPGYVWDQLVAARQASPGADAAYDDNPELDHQEVFWPLFVMVLLSNGWFLKPRVFNIQPGRDNVRQRQRRALGRLPLFFGAWLAGFAFLPLWLSSALLVGWLAWIAPWVVQLHRSFQKIA